MEINDIIEINNKEYACFKKIIDNNVKYVYLISTFEPVEIKFAKELDDERLEIINNLEEKQYANKLLQESL